MSHALAKLRTLTGDALFVRVPPAHRQRCRARAEEAGALGALACELGACLGLAVTGHAVGLVCHLAQEL